MEPDIRTDRLTFRRTGADDFAALLSIYGDPRVARMVASWPIPADPDVIRERCHPFPLDKGLVGVVERDDIVVGSMGIAQEQGQTYGMGYGFHPDHWGQGYATEMGRALVAAIFHRYPAERIKAGVWADNPGSSRVLEKLGFQHTHTGFGWSKGRDASAPAELYELTLARWLAANPLRLETDRLVIRAFAHADLPALHAIVDRIEIARNTASFPHPMSLEDTVNWALARRDQGRAGFGAGLFLRDGTLIGLVGISPEPHSAMYALGTDHWGRGYATEAMRALIGWAFQTYGMDEITADHFADNPASGRVLEKLGFERVGESMGDSKARTGPATVVEFRLKRS